MNWKMFAHKTDYGYRHFGVYRYVKAHYLDYPIVPVEVYEDSQGEFWGWIGTANEWSNSNGIPTMIWTPWEAFEMCFPYGSKWEVESGKGKIVRLSVKEIKNKEDEVIK